jgi:hypothetical protein
MEKERLVFGVVVFAGVIAMFSPGLPKMYWKKFFGKRRAAGVYVPVNQRLKPNQYAGFYGSGASTLEDEIPYAGFFGAGSSKLDEPVLPGSYSNARPSAGFLSMSSPILEDLYGPDRYIPWQQRG